MATSPDQEAWQVLPAGRELLRRKWRELLALFLGVLVPLSIFARLAREVVERETFWWDPAILRWLHAHATPTWDRIMLWASRIGIWYGVVPFSILFCAYLAVRRRIRMALFFLISMVGSALLNAGAKQFFGRPRPALWGSPAPETSFSFPSGHTMGSMALATALAVLAWPTRARWPVIVGGAAFVLLVSASRLYLGVHFPSDVLAGWMASLAWVLGLKHLILPPSQPSAAPA